MGARAIATTIIWITYLTMVGIAMGELGTWAILLAFVLMMPLIPIMGLMWNAKSSDAAEKQKAATSKRKREQLDTFIRDLSEEDFFHLKQRLMNQDIIEDNSAYMLGDDGEIVRMNEQKRK
jgi:hypothetical protein